MLSWRSPSLALAALLCAVALARPAAAQDTRAYTINGTVVDQTTERPLASVAVTFPGTQYGTLTDQAGRFSLQARMAPGTYALSYSMIGRGEATQEVTLADQRVVEVARIALRETA